MQPGRYQTVPTSTIHFTATRCISCILKTNAHLKLDENKYHDKRFLARNNRSYGPNPPKRFPCLLPTPVTSVNNDQVGSWRRAWTVVTLWHSDGTRARQIAVLVAAMINCDEVFFASDQHCPHEVLPVCEKGVVRYALALWFLAPPSSAPHKGKKGPLREEPEPRAARTACAAAQSLFADTPGASMAHLTCTVGMATPDCDEGAACCAR